MKNNRRYHRDNRNAAFSLVTLFGSCAVLMWVTFPDQAETHMRYTSVIVPLLVIMLGIGIHQHWKMKRKR
jgi:hypothetical protein